jgi:hypothetical protein
MSEARPAVERRYPLCPACGLALAWPAGGVDADVVAEVTCPCSARVRAVWWSTQPEAALPEVPPDCMAIYT